MLKRWFKRSGKSLKAIRSLAEKMLSELRTGPRPLMTSRRPAFLNPSLECTRVPIANISTFMAPPGTITTIPYYEVLKKEEKGSRAQRPFDFKGKAVFIGHSERFRPGQKDGFYTAFSQSSGLDLSGVEIAATAFSNLLTDQPDSPSRPGQPPPPHFPLGSGDRNDLSSPSSRSSLLRPPSD